MLKSLLARFSDTPSLISDQHVLIFQSCLQALASHEDFAKLEGETASEAASNDEFWFSSDDWRARYRPYSVKDGTLSIPVYGVLLHNFPWQFGSYATGYDYIWQAYKRGMDDPTVSRIALLIHSPGGEVAGNFDLVDRMYDMRGRKPVRAFAHEYAYSAAYSIASVASHIAMSRTGGVGSIGVVTAHVDMSKRLDEMGIKITFISAPEDGHKTDGNPYEPLGDETKARIQARINELYDVFVATVARNKGMDEKAIRDTKALTFGPSEAVSKGLADSVGPLDDAVAAFAADLSNTEGDEQMSGKTDAAVDQAAIDDANAKGHEAGKAEGLAEGRKEGATAERTRILAIIDSEEGKKRPRAALSLALKSEMSAEQASAVLADLAEEKAPEANADAEGDDKGTKKTGASATDFNAAMDKDAPNVGADGGDDEDEDGAEQALALARSFGMSGIRQVQ